MVKLNTKQGKEILATIKAAILNGEIGDIFADDFDASEVDWVAFRLSNSTWESKLEQKQFREACQRLITKLLSEDTGAREEAADMGVKPRPPRRAAAGGTCKSVYCFFVFNLSFYPNTLLLFSSSTSWQHFWDCFC